MRRTRQTACGNSNEFRCRRHPGLNKSQTGRGERRFQLNVLGADLRRREGKLASDYALRRCERIESDMIVRALNERDRPKPCANQSGGSGTLAGGALLGFDLDPRGFGALAHAGDRGLVARVFP